MTRSRMIMIGLGAVFVIYAVLVLAQIVMRALT